MAAIGKVETLVAQGEIGDLLAAEGHAQAGPVVERGIDDLVAGEPPLSVGQGHVADLAPPAFNQRHREMLGLELAKFANAGTHRPVGKPRSYSRRKATER